MNHDQPQVTIGHSMKLRKSIYSQLSPGDIEMGISNPVLLYQIYLKIMDHISHLDDSRKKNGIITSPN